MSRANPDRRDAGTQPDDWRVDAAEGASAADAPAAGEAEDWSGPTDGTHLDGPRPSETEPATEWSEAATTMRCARVSQELSAWREDLDERIERIERRLR